MSNADPVRPFPNPTKGTRWPSVLWVVVLCFAVSLVLPAPTMASNSARQITVIPTGADRAESLRINTGQKATLSDGSYNTVYTQKNPRPGYHFVRVHLDVAVENAYWSAEAERFRLANAEDPKGPGLTPVDWFRDNGLLEERAESIMIRDLASLEVTFEVAIGQESDLSLWVGGLFVGTMSELLAIRPTLGE